MERGYKLIERGYKASDLKGKIDKAINFDKTTYSFTRKFLKTKIRYH